MKKIVHLAVIALTLIACKEQQVKDYVTLSGMITNQNSDSLLVWNRDGFLKKISVESDGSFYDTLKVSSVGTYTFYDGTEMSSIYLENGFDVNLTLDTKEFDETIKYKGVGAAPNNYLAQAALLREKILSEESMFTLDQDDFDGKLEISMAKFSSLMSDFENLDTGFVADQTKKVEGFKKMLQAGYKQHQFLQSLIGQDSPQFVDYENHAGGTSSLDDFRGKYVYIDLWATWCNPCKYEIPFLKEIEEAYHDKNIVFVSISIDKSKNHQKWRDMVNDEQLTGVQLYANEDEAFVDAYGVKGIPRFILVNPDGKIVSADAPRPSNPELKTLLDDLI